MANDLDFLDVLRALSDIGFPVGRALLIDYLQGYKGNESVLRNRMDKLATFGSLSYTKEELSAMIDNLVTNACISYEPLQNKRFVKVFILTQKGKEELQKPSLHLKKASVKYQYQETVITEQDRAAFQTFDFFLGSFNEEQKKAIISPSTRVLCIAGAGTGKTTVLTKRVEFLCRYRSIDTSRVLAITFTRKARQEMMRRLEGKAAVQVETFNSFCEKILQRHNDIVYDRKVSVISYGEKMRLISKSLQTLGIGLERATQLYFNESQRASKTPEQLASIFMNDCFFIRDYFKMRNKPIEDFSNASRGDDQVARLVFGVVQNVDAAMRQLGLRDYTDQLVDTLELFRKRPELRPKFEHILVDEYQDVNAAQIELIELLGAPNLFCVGDPRQSIFGWRGSDIQFILGFNNHYPHAETVTLVKNYRSGSKIVSFVNKAIEPMKLPGLESTRIEPGEVKIVRFESEPAEFEFIVQSAQAHPHQDIFVLARTNRQLRDLSVLLASRGIAHAIRSEELRSSQLAEHGLTIATIHAIKGLEAKTVFVIGATTANFPCRTTEHPIIELFNLVEYDKEEEERRLFYVALSRARDTLVVSYTGKNPTYFLPALGKKPLFIEATESYKVSSGATGDLYQTLKKWRLDKSKAQGMPAYMVLTDSTLLELVQTKPATESDLEHINGLGPIKIKRYGKDILKLVNN